MERKGRVVYTAYRDMLRGYNERAAEILESKPASALTEDRGVADRIGAIIQRQQSQPGQQQGASPPPPPPPPPPPSLGQGGSFRIKSEMPAPRLEPPACVQNAMMTKDKKPFTYTPGGLDLSQIRSPRMARRISRNANSEGVAAGQQQQKQQQQQQQQQEATPIQETPQSQVPQSLKSPPIAQNQLPKSPQVVYQPPQSPKSPQGVYQPSKEVSPEFPKSPPAFYQVPQSPKSPQVVYQPTKEVPVVPKSPQVLYQSPQVVSKEVPKPYQPPEVPYQPQVFYHQPPEVQKSPQVSPMDVPQSPPVFYQQAARAPQGCYQPPTQQVFVHQPQVVEPARPRSQVGSLYVPPLEQARTPQAPVTRIIPIQLEDDTDAGGAGPPVQSPAFRVLQKMTSRDEQGAPSAAEQLQRMQLEADDRALMNRFRMQVTEDSFLHGGEADPRYRGAAIPSRAFRILQSMTDDADPTTAATNTTGVVRTVPIQLAQRPSPPATQAQRQVPASEQRVQEPRKYTGGAIPSRSFQMLQAMVAPGDPSCGPDQSDL